MLSIDRDATSSVGANATNRPARKPVPGPECRRRPRRTAATTDSASHAIPMSRPATTITDGST